MYFIFLSFVHTFVHSFFLLIFLSFFLSFVRSFFLLIFLSLFISFFLSFFLSFLLIVLLSVCTFFFSVLFFLSFSPSLWTNSHVFQQCKFTEFILHYDKGACLVNLELLLLNFILYLAKGNIWLQCWKIITLIPKLKCIARKILGTGFQKLLLQKSNQKLKIETKCTNKAGDSPWKKTKP